MTTQNQWIHWLFGRIAIARNRLTEISLPPTCICPYHTISFTVESMLSRTAAVSVPSLLVRVMV